MNTRIVLFAALAILLVTPVLANPMTEHSQSMSVDFNYSDVDDAGKLTNLGLSWSTLVFDNAVELGLLFGYSEVDPEFGASVDSNFIGPVIQYNISPQNNINPYLSFYLVNIGGDQGDFFDYEYGYGAGINVFIGDSASLNIGLGKSTQVGADNVQDVDITGLSVGMSFYFGKK